MKAKQFNQIENDIAQADLLPKIYWEKNSLVTQNDSIPDGQIIPKCKTIDFPEESITVRVQNQRRKVATVYFYGKSTTKTYGSGHSWSYVDEQLKVTLPMVGYNKKDYSYSFQGQLPSIFTLEKMTWALDYIQEQFDEMTGSNFTHFTGKKAA